MNNLKNRVVKNVKSPPNEKKYIAAYQQLNPKSAETGDGYDIAAVKAKNGERGHVMFPEGTNRSKNKEYHIGQDFISNDELRKQFKNKK